MGARTWSTPSPPPPPTLPAGPLNSSHGAIPACSPRSPPSAASTSMAVDLPPCLALPDGEEQPYGSSMKLRIRDYEQESEIYRECVRPPPNRTVTLRCQSVGVLSTPPPKTSCGMFCWKGCPKDRLDPRVVLDPDGQPVVMRSKSMSTGSSSCTHQSSAPLSVMVPVGKRLNAVASPPAASTVRSRVRTLCEKVTSSVRTDARAAVSQGVANAGYESCSSSDKLANLPVVSCSALSSSAAQFKNL